MSISDWTHIINVNGLFGIKLHSLWNTFIDIISFNLHSNSTREVGGIVRPILQIKGLFGGTSGSPPACSSPIKPCEDLPWPSPSVSAERQCCGEQGFRFGSICVIGHLQSWSPYSACISGFSFCNNHSTSQRNCYWNMGKGRNPHFVLRHSCMD